MRSDGVPFEQAVEYITSTYDLSYVPNQEIRDLIKVAYTKLPPNVNYGLASTIAEKVHFEVYNNCMLTIEITNYARNDQ